jgi:hypothetical protein
MTRFSKIFASAAFAAVLLPLATSAAPLNQPQMIASNNAIPMKFTTQETVPQDPNLMDLPYTVAKLQNQVVVQQVSTAAEKCARWRRNSVPVGLIKKGLEALLIDPRCEPRGA